jgi:putative hemolysin
MRIKGISSILLFVVLSWLVGCTAAPTPVMLANPASVYCDEQGGKLEIRTDADGGQYGVCIFEDGSECEEWAFFRGECKPEESDTQIANPASVYCDEQGGKLEIRTDADGGQYGVCIFEDGSECEEWAFFHGECAPGASDTQMANPASVYCDEQGGKLEIRTDEDGGQYGVCIFGDGSECEEWAFFRGECKPAE